MAADSPWSAVVARLGCLRGIDTLTAFALAVEIGDWERFTGASIGDHQDRQLPCPQAVGRSRLAPPQALPGGATIQARWQRAPAAARARGHLGNQRLNQRWKTFIAHHKRPVVANVAVARELAGWCWSLATLPD
ncbi:hypothetical protein AB0L75_40385 [Streptomyces sp. NPDC052101]|uniref:hypothetical protein n=1 Tax=Streptomyces sp. NPDC052101 TaxID=3155763 RepID=UPI0034353497